jgi:hypothetical protein
MQLNTRVLLFRKDVAQIAPPHVAKDFGFKNPAGPNAADTIAANVELYQALVKDDSYTFAVWLNIVFMLHI